MSQKIEKSQNIKFIRTKKYKILKNETFEWRQHAFWKKGLWISKSDKQYISDIFLY